MENERRGHEKGIGIASTVMLVVDVLILAIAVVMTISTQGNFGTVLTEMGRQDLSALTECLVSIRPISYVIFFASLLVVLVLKELLIDRKKASLVINIVAGVAGLLYIAVYIYAMVFPMR